MQESMHAIEAKKVYEELFKMSRIRIYGEIPVYHC